ncbi:hypothetical protein EKO27_g12036 [Xylaria grammica]|uniref:Mid2 domain-containing protein n=1 Tax=Xylaria grammica TaxID=363999 RepID=A0A439CLV9_9PEZI|nr:hypothetical protein EKO27_g12036 [Xylaria grammica]
MSRFLAAATLVTTARALAFDGRPAQATDAVVPDATFHLAEITEAPRIKELLKRQSEDQVVLIGPDNTCGFISGRFGAPVTCDNGDTCAFVYDASYGRAGCCNGDNCVIHDACLDYSEIYTRSACDVGCFQDSLTVKCTETTAPYCATISWFSGIVEFLCADGQITTPVQIYTTYAGETDGRRFETFTVTPSGSVSGDDAVTDGSFMLSFTSSARSSSTTDTSGGNSGSSGGGGSNGNSGNNNGNSGTSPDEKKPSTPIAPIVGGVVGGVGGLALIGVAIFFIVRHNNKKKAAGASRTADAADSGRGCNANYNQQPYQQQSTPPQGFYPPQEQKPAGFVTLSPTGVPDRHDSTSPVSQFSDARHSVQPQSPTSTLNSNWGAQPVQQQPPNVPPTVHEAGGNVVGETDYNSNHRGQFHEMQA